MSDVGLNNAGNEFGRSSMAGRGAGTCPSGMAPMMVSSASALKVTRSTSYSSPHVAGGGAGMCLSGSTLGRTSSGRASSGVCST